MKDVQCYELFGGIALKNHAFSFFHFHGRMRKKAALQISWRHDNYVFQKTCKIIYSLISEIEIYHIIFGLICSFIYTS